MVHSAAELWEHGDIDLWPLELPLLGVHPIIGLRSAHSPWSTAPPTLWQILDLPLISAIFFAWAILRIWILGKDQRWKPEIRILDHITFCTVKTRDISLLVPNGAFGTQHPNLGKSQKIAMAGNPTCVWSTWVRYRFRVRMRLGIDAPDWEGHRHI